MALNSHRILIEAPKSNIAIAYARVIEDFAVPRVHDPLVFPSQEVSDLFHKVDIETGDCFQVAQHRREAVCSLRSRVIVAIPRNPLSLLEPDFYRCTDSKGPP